jgi:acetyl-CoA C-acetyltransferase
VNEVFIVSAVRTPIGRFGGVFKDLSPVALGAAVMRAALERAAIGGDQLDMYVFGNVLRAGWGQLVPRQAALAAGIPESVDGYAIDMVCSSAMMSVLAGAHAIAAGEAALILTGGFESMSQAAFTLSHRARFGYRTLAGQPEELIDVMLYDGLTDPVTGQGMGEETDRLAREMGIARVDLEEVALASHQRAAAAAAAGIFAREIVPVAVPTRGGQALVERDEGIRPETSLAALAALRPAFGRDGLHTAGTSSQVSDGAAALVLASPEAVDAHHLRPLARIRGGAWSAGATWRFAEAPVAAVTRLLRKLGLGQNDVDLFENNEAFALSSLIIERQLKVPREKLNVHGGAIALGHPLGATGARLIVTLLNALAQRRGRLGVAALCHGTGGATALAVERVSD